MKKKFVIFISIISLFILIFSLSAFADDEWSLYGQTIDSGTTIVFNNNSLVWSSQGGGYTPNALSFNCNNTNYSYIMTFQNSKILYTTTSSSGTGLSLYDANSSVPINPNATTIILNQDVVLTQGDYISEFIINNAIQGLPEPPEPSAAEKAYTSTSGLISNSFYVISQITNFLSGNAAIGICTIGILVISFVFGLLTRIRKKVY